MNRPATLDTIPAEAPFDGDPTIGGGPDSRSRPRASRLTAPIRRELLAAWREPLLRNGHFLTMSSVGTALFGLLYWSLAAHRYDTVIVGRSSAVISAVMLIGGVAQLNLISALVRFVPVAGPRTRRLVVTSYAVAAALALVLGAAFVLVAPAVSSQFDFLTAHPLMAVGVVLAGTGWTVFVLQDSVLTGLRLAILVAAENAVFSVVKVAAVVGLVVIAPQDGILASWWIGLAVSVVATNLYLFRRALPRQRTVVGSEGLLSAKMVARFAGPDYVGGLCWLGLTTATPLVVIASVGARGTAYFAVAWQFGVALFALSANMGASLMVETASDQADLARRWRRVVGHSLLPLGLAVAVIEAGAPVILRLFGPAYAQHATGLLRLVALAAVPNLVTETAVFAARSLRRTAAASAILGAISVGVLGLSAVLLPVMGIVGVGVACVVAESVVAVVVLSRPSWWLDIQARPRSAGDERILLAATVSLLAAGVVMLAVGLLVHEVALVLVSLGCSAASAVPLALFYRASRQATAQPHLWVPAPVVPAGRLPIEGYHELRVDEILPLLQELDVQQLQAVRDYELSGQARPAVLARIELLVISAQDSALSSVEEVVFPIEGYDELRVVDILPLLPQLSPEELDAVAAREEAGAMRITILSKIARLHERAERARMAPVASDG